MVTFWTEVARPFLISASGAGLGALGVAWIVKKWFEHELSKRLDEHRSELQKDVAKYSIIQSQSHGDSVAAVKELWDYLPEVRDQIRAYLEQDNQEGAEATAVWAALDKYDRMIAHTLPFIGDEPWTQIREHFKTLNKLTLRHAWYLRLLLHYGAGDDKVEAKWDERRNATVHEEQEFKELTVLFRSLISSN